MADNATDTQEPQEAQEVTGLLLDDETLANTPLDGEFKLPLRREGTEEENEEAEDEVEETEEDEAEPAPQPAIAPLEDPGEFKPGDYSFDVVVYDEKGEKGKTVKIKSPEQWDELLDTDPNFGSAAALMKAQRAVTRMENATEREKQAYEDKKKAFDDQQTTFKQREETLTGWQKEVDYLVSQKKLPGVPKEFVDADWSDPEVAKQPGVKEQVELFKYMEAENKRRATVGLPLMRSVLEAYNAKRLDDVDTGAAQAKKRQEQARKQRGAMVNRAQSAPVKSAPKGMIVGTGGSLDELETFGLV